MTTNTDNPNIDLIAGKHVTDLPNNNQRLSIYDKLKSIVAEVQSKHQAPKDGHYLGCLLDTVKRTAEDIKDIYGFESKFYSDIVKQHGKSEIKPDSTIYECRVHIPELTGMLPWPKQSLINAAKSDPSEAAQETTDAEKRAKEYPGKVAAAFPELMKLMLYPKFFYYDPDAGAPQPGRMCIVKFSDGMPTRGLGIYVETLSDAWVEVIPDELF